MFKWYIDNFRPSLKSIFWESWIKSRGFYFEARFPFADPIVTCYICGRRQDYIFRFVNLIPHFDMSLENKLVYICDDHGRVTDYDCRTGEAINLPLPRPYWYRYLRNTLQRIILYSVIPFRFIWFFVYSLLLWYVLIYPYWGWREFKRKLCES